MIIDDLGARFIVGDVFDVMASMPDGSVDLVLTSPPFLALRSYLPPDHPDKGREIGAEPTPAEFLGTLLALAAEWRRIIAPHGSIAVELGDTYAGSGGSGGDYNEGGMREGQAKWAGTARSAREPSARIPWKGERAGWPMDKSLCGIPHLFHLSLAYGINLLTGEPSPAGRWRIRNVVAWCRPNPPVGALGDKVRPATSYMTIATVARDRYFDLDAVRTPSARTDNERTTSTQYQAPGQPERRTRAADESGARIHANAGGAPPLDHWWIDDEDSFDQDAWLISTQPYRGSHYATWPKDLCRRPILSMVPPRVCTTCGHPSRRIVEKSPEYAAARSEVGDFKAGRGRDAGLNGTQQYVNGQHMDRADNVTIGWTDCGHDTWRLGMVLDPFAGSGTTLAVANGLSRNAIGIDIDERNAWLASDRVGPMFLDIEHHTPAEVAS